MTCGCVLAEAGAFGGILFGQALERIQREEGTADGTAGKGTDTGTESCYPGTYADSGYMARSRRDRHISDSSIQAWKE